MPRLDDFSGPDSSERPAHHEGKGGLVVSLRIGDEASPRDSRRTKDEALKALYGTVRNAGFDPEADGDFFTHETRHPWHEAPDGTVTRAHTMWYLAWKPRAHVMARNAQAMLNEVPR